MKKVLIITNRFSPYQSVGAIRLRGLAKYLPMFNWEPTILTSVLTDYSKKIDSKYKIIRTPYRDIVKEFKKRFYLDQEKGFQEQFKIPISKKENKIFFINVLINFILSIIAFPDKEKGWYSFGVKKGNTVLKENKFNALISSSGPVTSHLIAKELKIKHNIPWIADLRDLWTQNHNYPYRNLRKYFERRLELKTLGKADALVTVSKPLSKKLGILHSEKPVFTIVNGFDPDDITDNVLLTKNFAITYTGKLYQDKQNPEILLKALHELILERVIDSNVVKVRFYGHYENWLEQEIRKYGLENIAKQYGKVSRENSLKKQRESHVLLFVNWNDLKETGIYSAKIFEYLFAKRPIIAVNGPKSVIDELLKKTNSGFFANNLSQTKNILKKYYNEYITKGEVCYYGKNEEIYKYSHYEMAKKYANLLNKICR